MQKVQEANNLKHFHSHNLLTFCIDFSVNMLGRCLSTFFLAFYHHEQTVQMY